MKAIDTDTLEAMIRAPVEHFATPLAVTQDKRLNHAQKAAVLKAWAQSGRDLLAGASKDMPADLDRSYLAEIEHAIDRLAELRRD